MTGPCLYDSPHNQVMAVKVIGNEPAFATVVASWGHVILICHLPIEILRGNATNHDQDVSNDVVTDLTTMAKRS